MFNNSLKVDFCLLCNNTERYPGYIVEGFNNFSDRTYKFTTVCRDEFFIAMSEMTDKLINGS